MESWSSPAKVDEYLDRIARLEPRLAGEAVLREVLPDAPASVLDLGCGDGRLASLVLAACPSVQHVTAVDVSPPMLTAARERFVGDDRVVVAEWDLTQSINRSESSTSWSVASRSITSTTVGREDCSGRSPISSCPPACSQISRSLHPRPRAPRCVPTCDRPRG